MNISKLFHQMKKEEASDLLLTVGKKPSMRIFGKVEGFKSHTPITEAEIFHFLKDHLLPSTLEQVKQRQEVDVGISLDAEDRFRLNIFYQKGVVSIVARRVPSGALDFTKLGLPSIIHTLSKSERGLLLITGATGSGKSTTMAAILHSINTTFSKHIVTIEDPIEFMHQDQLSLVTQREIGSDTKDFSSSLKYVVRQSPDVIFIGELRDMESIHMAISAAMTGHLVVTTMHTMDVTQTVERIINFFPDYQREQIAMDFSMALQGIISQRLVPKITEGVAVAIEVLVATPLIRNIIRKLELQEIENALKAGSPEGMQTFTRSLTELYQAGLINAETGAAAASNRDEFLLSIQGMETGIDSLRQRHGKEEGSQVSMKNLLHAAIKHQASDLLLSANNPPILRIDGELHELSLAPLTPANTQRLVFSILNPAQRAHLESEKEIDFALSISALDQKDQKDIATDHRFRINSFYQKGSLSGAIRLISQTIPNPRDLHLPQIIIDLAEKPHGLILVTGPTGHGKSTTLACMINDINSRRACHIITVEDPIEYVHQNQKAVIEQREVYADTKSFSHALKYVLRQDPDVILIGEMRDQETVAAALTAAETGHLVLATLHTNDAVQTVDRIIDIFPAYQQNQIRSQLAFSLRGVIAQRLVPRIDKAGRIGVFEIMTGTPPVQALIRDNRAHLLLSTLETSAKDGMITMDKSLMNLYKEKKISAETVLSLVRDKANTNLEEETLADQE